jgi:hypothetical protein
MNTVAIPGWNVQGVLPPINPTMPTHSERSPYAVSLTDVVLRFGTSPERLTILAGFLSFRSALHNAGLVSGFQWINGSFLEDIERMPLEKRSPRDIDTVTFYFLPEGQTQNSLFQAFPRLFRRDHTKQDYHVDAYFEQLNGDAPEALVRRSAYWYSIWSHRRNGQWKGYLQVGLSSNDDEVAKVNLENIKNQGPQS